jgi:hypothetical protein
MSPSSSPSPSPSPSPNGSGIDENNEQRSKIVPGFMMSPQSSWKLERGGAAILAALATLRRCAFDLLCLVKPLSLLDMSRQCFISVVFRKPSRDTEQAIDSRTNINLWSKALFLAQEKVDGISLDSVGRQTLKKVIVVGVVAGSASKRPGAKTKT